MAAPTPSEVRHRLETRGMEIDLRTAGAIADLLDEALRGVSESSADRRRYAEGFSRPAL